MKPAESGAHEIESPSGVDLHPQPPSAVRLSKRAGVVALAVAFGVLASVGYGIVTRSGRSLPLGFHADDSKGLTAATDAGKAIAAQVPTRAGLGRGNADPSATQPEELQPPDSTQNRGVGTSTNQRANAPTTTPAPAPVPQYREPTPEEKRLVAAYEREMLALDSPTAAQA